MKYLQQREEKDEAENYKEAFNEGSFSYWYDIPFHENPYGSCEQGDPRFEKQFKAWRNGWNTAELEVFHGVSEEAT